MKKYLVTLSRVEYQAATVEVEAESEEEAANAAMDEAEFRCSDAEQEVLDIQEVSYIAPATP